MSRWIVGQQDGKICAGVPCHCSNLWTWPLCLLSPRAYGRCHVVRGRVVTLPPTARAATDVTALIHSCAVHWALWCLCELGTQVRAQHTWQRPSFYFWHAGFLSRQISNPVLSRSRTKGQWTLIEGGCVSKILCGTTGHWLYLNKMWANPHGPIDEFKVQLDLNVCIIMVFVRSQWHMWRSQRHMRGGHTDHWHLGKSEPVCCFSLTQSLFLT